MLAVYLFELLDVILQLQKNDGVRVLVTGHTDIRGSDAYNLTLSQLRANTIRAYLIKNGVDEKSVFTFGVGSSQPSNACVVDDRSNCSDQGRKVVVDVFR